MKQITIATDISNDGRFKITTWACYIRYNGKAIKKVGQFKRYYSNTAKAETYALINTLTIAKNSIPDWEDSKVVIHNEIEYVLTPIRTKAGNIRLRDADRSEQIRRVALPILSEAMSWERHKIKAHYDHWQTSKDPLKYMMNRWCDVNSREMLIQLREEKRM